MGAPELSDARSPAEAARIPEFALERFEVEDGRAIVVGRWHGVLGRRFVRPVLRIGGQRRRIALLEHKPWAAQEGEPWIAAFELDGEAGPARLQVAPDIAVDLPAPGPDAGGGERLPARAAGAPAAAERKATAKSATAKPDRTLDERTRLAILVEDGAAERERLTQQFDAAGAERDRLAEKLEASRSELETARAEIAELRTALESARDELDVARRDAERARSETERMKRRVDESSELVESLRAQADSSEAARGRALVEREEMRRELEDARRSPGRALSAAPYLPSFREPARRSPNWGLRAGAFAALVLLLYALAWLVSAAT